MAAIKSGKKRAAPTQAEHAHKKKRLQENKRATNAQDRPISTEKKTTIRKKPITAPARNESDTEEGDASDNGDFGGLGGDDEVEDEREVEDENQMDIVGPDSSRNGLKSAKESHKAQKVLQQERRAAKQHSALLADAKSLWSKARQKDVPREERQKYVKQLMDVVRGKVQDVVFKHDASRIIQTIVKYGGQKERDEIAAELKGKYKELAQNKYSKFLVTKLIRNCPAHRTSVLLEFKGHVVRLLLHREATNVIADAYELYANAFERALLLFDMYGKEVTLFTPALGKGAAASEKEKDELKKGLKGVLEKVDMEKRKRILASLKENLDLILNNTEKGAVSHSIFHRALWEYLSQLNELDNEEEKDKLRRDLFETSQEILAEMVHTKDGSRVVREFIAQGSAKDRKQIVKVLKPHVERICTDDEAQLVLFTALDVIDDTKLSGKSLVAEVVSLASSLYTSPQGRRALLHLLVPRSRRHFTPAQIALLAETDAIKAKTSKKDDKARQREVLKFASDGLLNLLESMDKAEELLRDPGGSLLLTEIMLYAEGDKSKALKSLVTPLQQLYPSPDESRPHVIDVPHSCRVYKTLLQGGHYSQQEKAVIRAPSFSPAAFASEWLISVEKENSQAMGLGGGAFVLSALCERVKAEGSEAEKTSLKEWFDESFVKKLNDSDAKGRQVFIESL